MIDSPTIFLSYSWRDFEIANQIDTDLSALGIPLIRDVRDVKFKGDLKDYMKRIGQSDFAFVLISDAFLKSRNCMHEILEIFHLKDFHQRIIPILVKGANFFSPTGRIGYLKHWENAIAEIKTEVQMLESPEKAQGILSELNSYHLIHDSIDPFLSYLSNHLSYRYEDVISNGYGELLEYIGFAKKEIIFESTRIKSLENYEDREMALADALSKYPENRHFLLRKGYHYQIAGMFKMAERVYEDLIEKYPRFTGALNNFASLQLDLGNKQVAKEYLLKVVGLSPRNVRANTSLAVVSYFVDKNPEQTKYYIDVALEIDRNYEKANLVASYYYRFVNKDSEKSKFHQEIAFQLNPSLQKNDPYLDFLAMVFDPNYKTFESPGANIPDEDAVREQNLSSAGRYSGGGFGIAELRDML